MKELLASVIWPLKQTIAFIIERTRKWVTWLVFGHTLLYFAILFLPKKDSFISKWPLKTAEHRSNADRHSFIHSFFFFLVGTAGAAHGGPAITKANAGSIFLFHFVGLFCYFFLILNHVPATDSIPTTTVSSDAPWVMADGRIYHGQIMNSNDILVMDSHRFRKKKKEPKKKDGHGTQFIIIKLKKKTVRRRW